MNHDIGAFVMVQRLSLEPIDKLGAIVSGKDVLDRVFRPQCNDPFRYGQQEQIMIAEDDLDGGAKLFEVAQDAKRIRAAIDQIADAPEAVYGRIKPDEFEQAFQGARAALDIADCVDGHRVEKKMRWCESIAPRVYGYFASILLDSPPRAVNPPVTVAQTGRQDFTTSRRIRLTAFS